jgi:carbamoylphosphate synthase large subunit
MSATSLPTDAKFSAPIGNLKAQVALSPLNRLIEIEMNKGVGRLQALGLCPT